MKLAESLERFVTLVGSGPMRDGLQQPNRIGCGSKSMTRQFAWTDEKFVSNALESLDVDLHFITDWETWSRLMANTITPTEAWFQGRIQLPGAGANRAGYVWLISLFRIYQGRLLLARLNRSGFHRGLCSWVLAPTVL